MSRFDQFAKNYERTVEDATRLFGEKHDYFTRQKVQQLNEYLKQINTPDAGPLNILEVGCGTGGIQGHLALLDFRHRSFAVDTSVESVKVARGRNAAIQYAGASAAGLPFKTASMDVVCFAVVVHHIPPSLRPAAFGEVHRVLRPGGVVAVFEHNPFNPLTQWIVKTCEFDRDAVLVTMPRLQKQLATCGFRIDRSRYTTFFPKFLNVLRPLENSMGWIPLGGQYYVVGRKE